MTNAEHVSDIILKNVGSHHPQSIAVHCFTSAEKGDPSNAYNEQQSSQSWYQSIWLYQSNINMEKVFVFTMKPLKRYYFFDNY